MCRLPPVMDMPGPDRRPVAAGHVSRRRATCSASRHRFLFSASFWSAGAAPPGRETGLKPVANQGAAYRRGP